MAPEASVPAELAVVSSGQVVAASKTKFVETLGLAPLEGMATVRLELPIFATVVVSGSSVPSVVATGVDVGNTNDDWPTVTLRIRLLPASAM